MLNKLTLHKLVSDAHQLGIAFSEQDLVAIQNHASHIAFKKREVIYQQHKIGNGWLFINKGIAASQQTHHDGKWSIARFFEANQLCGNLTSTWSQSYAQDDLVACTDLEGIELEHEFFQYEYVKGGNVGHYLRHKVIQTLCFDKEIIVVKTLSDIKTGYNFLKCYQPEILNSVLKKDIAAFLGVTPQGLAKFLRNVEAQ